MARRVLVLTYYFPPSGGPGVQRILKTVKYLPDLGWVPHVLTVREGAYPAHDSTLRDDIPTTAAVHRTSAWDPYQAYAWLTGQSDDDAVVQGSVEGREKNWKEQLARWVRANLFLPDARVGWVPFAVWRGCRLLATHRMDAILTTGPPHSTHLAGAALERWTGVPWVADFRDPWTDINYYHELPHTEAARRIDRALERMVLRRAAAVTTVSPSWRRLLIDKGDESEARSVHVVQNGFDEADIERGRHAIEEERFVLTHVGSLYASRNPLGVWRALRRLRDASAVPRLRIRLVGMVDPTVREAIRSLNLEDITEVVPYVPHEEAVAYMQRAGLLLLSIEDFPASAGMLTGKIYEYLATGRPIVGVGDPDGDAAALLRTTGGGRLFGRYDVEGLAQFIRAHYEDWRIASPRLGASLKALQPYRRRAQTERMAAVLNDVTS
ncbi:MAG: glycosyltransferase [Salinivenus sp.]